MIVDGKVSIPRVTLHMSRPLTLILGVSLAVVFLHRYTGDRWISISPIPLTIVGAALSFFITFRNNTVYDRWWEARTLWGALVNHSRTFARQAFLYIVPASPEDEAAVAAYRREMVLRHVGFVHALRSHLRGDEPCVALEPFVPAAELEHHRSARNVPSSVLHRQGLRLHDAWQRGWVREFHLPEIDRTLTEFTNILGACERIKNTPVPPVYTYLAHRIVIAYCCVLPFGIVKDVGWPTPLIVLFISFAFLILDRISLLIETPFATRVNDLPLTALSRNIEIDLLQRLGEENLPPPVTPREGVLL
jgi:Predicted membrane protein